MHLTILLLNLLGLTWYVGGSRLWVWGRREDGAVLYLLWGLYITCSIFLPYSAFS